MNRRARRADHSCSRRAATSLPVPVSPVSSTGIDVRAACATSRSTARAESLAATDRSVAGTGGSTVASSAMRWTSRAIAPGSRASMTSYAPRATAAPASSDATVPDANQIHRKPVRRTVGLARPRPRCDDLGHGVRFSLGRDADATAAQLLDELGVRRAPRPQHGRHRPDSNP